MGFCLVIPFFFIIVLSLTAKHTHPQGLFVPQPLFFFGLWLSSLLSYSCVYSSLYNWPLSFTHLTLSPTLIFLSLSVLVVQFCKSFLKRDFPHHYPILSTFIYLSIIEFSLAFASHWLWRGILFSCSVL